MVTRRYLIHSAADLAAWTDLSRAAVSAWAQRWLLAGEKEPDLLRVEDASRQSWRPETVGHALGYADKEKAAFCVLDKALVAVLCDMALGPDRHGGQGVVRASWAEMELSLAGDIVGGLIQEFLGRPEPFVYGERMLELPPFDLPAGSGWLKLVLAVGSLSLVLWLNQDTVLSLRPVSIPGKKLALRPRSSALPPSNLRIEAVAGEAEISISDLLELRPGHVVRLDTRFGEPMKLFSKSAGQFMEKAWLGAHDGKKSLQINAE